MSRPPRWMAGATEPTDAEVSGLTGGDPAVRGAAEATEPSDAEVDALLRTLRSSIRITILATLAA